MSDGATKATRYTDQGIKVIVTKNDTEPTFTLSFTENPAALTFEEHASLSISEGKRAADGKHTSEHHHSKREAITSIIMPSLTIKGQWPH